MEEAGGLLVKREEALSGAGAGGVGGGPGGESEAVSEQLYRFLERHLLDHLDEAKEVAAGLAAEAVPEPLVGVDGERRGSFLVEGAEPGEAAPGLAEPNVRGDDIDDIGSAADFLEVPTTPGHYASPPGGGFGCESLLTCVAFQRQDLGTELGIIEWERGHADL